MKRKFLFFIVMALAFGLVSTSQASIFDFESDTSYPEFTGGSVKGTQGYSSYGFGNYFLWSGGETITLTLTGLPNHNSIDVDFLLAVIDSWDGNTGGQYAPDYFNVSVDGNNIFHETFDIFDRDDQSYHVTNPLIFGYNIWNYKNTAQNKCGDSAYDMSHDNTFKNIPHTSDTLTISWWASGDGWQGNSDESFAIDNITVTPREASNPVPVPPTILLLGSGLALIGCGRKRSSRRA